MTDIVLTAAHSEETLRALKRSACKKLFWVRTCSIFMNAIPLKIKKGFDHYLKLSVMSYSAGGS